MPAMTPSQRKDPYLGTNFLVEIKGLVVAGFNEVSGLQVEIEVQEYREGGFNEFIHRLPGPARYPSNLVLKRGVADNDELWKWHQEIRQGKITRRDCSIIFRDSSGAEKRRWTFEGAYPTRWIGPDLRAGSAAIAIEAVEFAHRGLQRT
ncbi:MAG: phage tail protein [Anaerolineae bacterium]|jgi:phage tail-like protein|nr:phage tail protein [Anaerolineae bacterium]